MNPERLGHIQAI